jgi:hypothetical protein
MNKFLLLIISFLLVSCAPKAKEIDQKLSRAIYDNSKLASGTLEFVLPGSWQETAVTKPMRLRQFVIDPISQTELAVFYFENMQGTVQENIDRWVNQFESANRKLIKQEAFNIANIPVTVFYMTGTYLHSPNPMDVNSPKTPLADHSMYAIIAETASGTWFLKSYGPSKVIGNQESNFDKLVNSFVLR